MDFAKINLRHEDDFFKKILWSNISKIVLFGYNDATHVWREDRASCSQKNTIPTMKHGGGNIMVWGCFVYSGTEELEIIDNTTKTAYLSQFNHIELLNRNK